MRAVPDASAPLPAMTLAPGLPRADALTDALLSRSARPEALAEAVGEARERIERGLAGAAAMSGAAPVAAALPAAPTVLRIGHYQIAHALADATGPTRGGSHDEPFRWTSRTARRSIGLAAVRAGLDGRAAEPAGAVAMVMADPGGPLGIGRTGPGSCADWIAALAPAARTLVAAEATAWATMLWSALDWGRLAPARVVVGGPDRWWRWAGPGAAARIAVRGRADVRVGWARGQGAAPNGAHLVVLDGQPDAATRRALALPALVDALSARPHEEPLAVPAHVVGWWPDCGKAWVVAVDARTLAAAADAVVWTAQALLGARVPSERSRGTPRT